MTEQAAQQQENPEVAPEGAPEETPANEAPKDNENPEPNQEDELPEWARKKLQKANNEAASYRTQLREAQSSLASAKTPEEFEAIAAKLAATEHQLLVRDHTAGLPTELVTASWVSWPTDEEGVKKVAAELRALAASQQDPAPGAIQGGDLQGGLNPSGGDKLDEVDPRDFGRAARQRRYGN